MMDILQEILVSPIDSIREAMLRINRCGSGVVLVIDEDRRLKDAITDGDIRRSILAGCSVDTPLALVMEHKRQYRRSGPVTAPCGTSRDDVVRIMQERDVKQLPLLDESGRVVELVMLDQLVSSSELPVKAVIMAGGFGTRLRPLTDDTPKPMLPIAGRPLLERMIERLRDCGIRQINVTTHYMPEKIIGHFGDGTDFGVKLDYVSEDQPLGTAGSLRLVADVDEPLLVINGDILTSVDFADMLAFHRENRADMTIGVGQYDFEVPYGVVESDQGIVRQVREKPRYEFLVNAGIYLIEPSVRRYIPDDHRYDMTDLIARLLAEGHTVASFPIVEYWLDIGQQDDFHRAQKDVPQMRWAS